MRDRTRPIAGGLSIGNSRYDDAGTLGEIIKLNDEPGLFLISCWHVLCGRHGQINDDIVQPGILDNGNVANCKIARLHSYRLTDQVDVAFAQLNIDIDSRPGVMHLGRTRNIIRPTEGMRVIKCGRSTEVTTGRIHSVNATARISGYPGGTAIFYNQILTNNMSAGGDSGAVLLEENSNDVVGLLIGGNEEDKSIFNHMTRVFSSLNDHTFKRNESISEDQTLFNNINPNQ
ncbi:MAG: hypothetical protein GXC73_20175 [Chitinophagaceae bacterium]|nr:hypothetical protein [Chitinophagaceae bacterium]